MRVLFRQGASAVARKASSGENQTYARAWFISLTDDRLHHRRFFVLTSNSCTSEGDPGTSYDTKTFIFTFDSVPQMLIWMLPLLRLFISLFSLTLSCQSVPYLSRTESGFRIFRYLIFIVNLMGARHPSRVNVADAYLTIVAASIHAHVILFATFESPSSIISGVVRTPCW